MAMTIEEARRHVVPRGQTRVTPHLSSRLRGNSAADERLASVLAIFSLGLGLAEVAAPRAVARAIGMSDDERNLRILRGFGLREIASGLGILTQPRNPGWIWGRVVGDAMDLAFLGSALTSGKARKDRIVAAGAAVAGVTALDLLCAERMSARAAAAGQGIQERAIHVRKAITVDRPAEDLYRFWRNVENLPRFMTHLRSVEVLTDRRSHWKASAPLGRTVEWDAEIIEDHPGHRIAWRSLKGADVDNEGAVTFERAPGGRGTMVKVELHYDPPGGVLGATIAKLFGQAPGQQVQEDLRVFKQVMETGDVVRSEASVASGHPARPPAIPPVLSPVSLSAHVPEGAAR